MKNVLTSGGGKNSVAPAPLLTKNDMQILTESKSRELIKNQPFVEIASQFTTADWDGKPLQEDMVYHLNKMGGLKVAIIRDNRRTFKRSMKMFKACKGNGMTTPAILVTAKIVHDWGLSIVDPTSGKELSEDELKDYYCVMEGHARLDAWVLSILYASQYGEAPFDYLFVFKEYASPEDFGRAYVSTNSDMTRTTGKDRLNIAANRSKDPLVTSYLSKIKSDLTIPKASLFWTYGRELTKEEISKLIYSEFDAPKFDEALTDALSLCYNIFKEKFAAEGAEKIYRGVSAAQWCADRIGTADDKVGTAIAISDKVKIMTNDVYTAILTASTNRKKHITRDQVIKLQLDKMMK